MELEIKKSDTTLDLCKEKDGTITIENSFQDTMGLISVQFSLTQEEAKRVIVQLQKYCE
jgi:hypothetical protein